MTSSTRAGVAAALACVLLASACAGTPATIENIGATVSAVPPLPAGAATTPAAVATGTPAPQNCDPVASFRPPAGMPAPGAMPSGSTMARIQARGRLIVGVDENTYLFAYLNASDGQIEGFDIDVADTVAAALFGSSAGHIELKVIPNDQRIPDLLNGSVDIVVDTMTENCDRWRQIAFSTEYYAAAQRLLVDRNSPYRSLADLGGRRVCVEAGSTSIATIARAAGHPIPVSARNIADCLVMLEQGEADAVSTDDSILAGLAAQDPQTHVVGPALEPEPYGIGVAPDHLDLVRFVNGVLDGLRADGGWTALYNRWLTPLGPAPAPPPPAYRD